MATKKDQEPKDQQKPEEQPQAGDEVKEKEPALVEYTFGTSGGSVGAVSKQYRNYKKGQSVIAPDGEFSHLKRGSYDKRLLDADEVEAYNNRKIDAEVLRLKKLAEKREAEAAAAADEAKKAKDVAAEAAKRVEALKKARK